MLKVLPLRNGFAVGVAVHPWDLLLKIWWISVRGSVSRTWREPSAAPTPCAMSLNYIFSRQLATAVIFSLACSAGRSFGWRWGWGRFWAAILRWWARWWSDSIVSRRDGYWSVWFFWGCYWWRRGHSACSPAWFELINYNRYIVDILTIYPKSSQSLYLLHHNQLLSQLLEE